MNRVGRYEIVQSLARGGMGEVLLGRLSGPAGFARPVVLKRVRSDIGKQEQAQAMLLDEARLTSRLTHPNIAQGIDLVEADDGIYLVMEYVEGTDFGRLLRLSSVAGEDPDLFAVSWVVSRVACALHFAHHAVDPTTARPLSVIHRDVTPSNVLLSLSGDVKLSDFGVAKADTQQVKTMQGTLKGKVGYLSPEQCNLRSLDGRSDVFSLGIVLHEALTLRRLFREKDPMESMRRICDDDTPPPSSKNPKIPRDLDAIALRALQRDPNDRFESAGAFQRALEDWIYGNAPSGNTLTTSPVEDDAGRMLSPDRKVVEWVHRHLDDDVPHPLGPTPNAETKPEVRTSALPAAASLEPPSALAAESADPKSDLRREGLGRSASGRSPAADTLRVRQTASILADHLGADMPTSDAKTEQPTRGTPTSGLHYPARHGGVDAIGLSADALSIDPQVTASVVSVSFPLPRFSTPHVGRDVELQAMRAHFQHGGRALSVVGERGVGKTRLCVEFCRRVRAEGARRPFRAEIYVDATMLTRLDSFCERMADALDVQLLPADEGGHLQQLAAALHSLGDVLIVFDDVREGHAPAAIASLQSQAPMARFLTISRTALPIPGYSVFQLRAFADDTAVQSIFVGGVLELRPDFVVGAVDGDLLARVLGRLHGHPQSIALVAGVVGSANDPVQGLAMVGTSIDMNPALADREHLAQWALAASGDDAADALSLIAAFESPALVSEITECAAGIDARRLHRLLRRGFLRLVHGPTENAYVVTDLVRNAVQPGFDDYHQTRAVTVARAEFALETATAGRTREASRAYLEFVRERLLPSAEQALLAKDPEVAARLALVALRMGSSSTHATALLDRIAHALGDDDTGANTAARGLGVRLEIALGNALAKRGKDKGAARVLAHAAAVARRSSDDKSLAEALLEQGKVDAKTHPVSARAALDEALAIAIKKEDSLLEERVRTARAQVLVGLDLDKDAYADLERARDLARARSSRPREGRLALAMAAIADRADHTVVATDEARIARAHLEAAGDTRGAFEASLLLGHVLAAESQFVDAKRAFVYALSLATKQGDIPSQVRSLGALAAASALDEGRSAAGVYMSGLDALLPAAPQALLPTVAVYRSIIDFADGGAAAEAVNINGADAMVARLFERIAIGRKMASTAVH